MVIFSKFVTILFQASARTVHEYQFLQDQSGIQTDTYGQVTQSPYHDSPVDTLRGRASPFVHGDEPLSRVHGVQGQISCARHLSQQDMRGHVFPSPQRDDDGLLQRDTYTNNRTISQSIVLPIMGPEDPNLFPAQQAFHDDTELRLERKRKVC